jgi:hypothetical protein
MGLLSTGLCVPRRRKRWPPRWTDPLAQVAMIAVAQNYEIVAKRVEAREANVSCPITRTKVHSLLDAQLSGRSGTKDRGAHCSSPRARPHPPPQHPRPKAPHCQRRGFLFVVTRSWQNHHAASHRPGEPSPSPAATSSATPTDRRSLTCTRATTRPKLSGPRSDER